uniref:proline-rich receptor-like protein kinase PERK2 n=1 Tax=Odobenus rosmarus divergens TaxID=9708 RepID=UPI00063CDD95|nr:PREDICTED: proline-rich receptor-like protein kinase PERK2 [Odobenus rosmarus divergens]
MAPRRGGPGAGSRGAARPRAGPGPTSLSAPDPPPAGLPRGEGLLPPLTRGPGLGRRPPPQPLPAAFPARAPTPSPFELPPLRGNRPPPRAFPPHLLLGPTWNAERPPGVSPSWLPPFTLPDSELCHRCEKIIVQLARCIGLRGLEVLRQFHRFSG